MKVLVTGGTGLVGRALVSKLAQSGHQVVVTTRARANAGRSLSAPNVQLREWTATRRDLLDLSDIDCVVHLAGSQAVGVRYTPDSKREILESRVESAASLVEAMTQAGAGGPKRFLSASGVGFYGAQPGDLSLSEAAPAGTGFLAEVCVAWEEVVRGAEGAGVSSASLRLGVVLSPDGGALDTMARPFRLLVGGPIGSGKQVMSWVHVVDTVAAIEFLLARPDLRGPFNVAAPMAVTNEQFSQTLGQVLKRPSSLRTPAFALRALFGEGADPILTGQRAVPERLLQNGFSFQFPTLEPALRACL
jgi:uncharacterized protein